MLLNFDITSSERLFCIPRSQACKGSIMDFLKKHKYIYSTLSYALTGLMLSCYHAFHEEILVSEEKQNHFDHY